MTRMASTSNDMERTLPTRPSKSEKIDKKVKDVSLSTSEEVIGDTEPRKKRRRILQEAKTADSNILRQEENEKS